MTEPGGFIEPIQEAEAERILALRKLLPLFALVLLGLTAPLWGTEADFPRIAWIQILNQGPLWLERIAGGALGVGLLIAVFSPPGRRWETVGFSLFGTAALWMILGDQHRLQPWMYQFLLTVLIVVSLPDRAALFWLRLLAITLYAYSGLSKLDQSFLNTHGQQLAAALIGSVGGTPEHWSSGTLRTWAALMPAGELLAALLLATIVVRTAFDRTGSEQTSAFNRTACDRTEPEQKAASVGSIGIGLIVSMHGLLLLTLGPWGLNHKPGVLVWNVFCAVQVVLLFGRFDCHRFHGSRCSLNRFKTFRIRTWFAKNRVSADSSHETVETASSPERQPNCRLLRGGARMIVVGALLFPLAEPWGWFDHWPAWALYASRPERVTICIDGTQRDRLPPEIRPYLDARPLRSRSVSPFFWHSEADWCEFRPDRWSLEALNAPIYPQSRFQIGIALALAERYRLEDSLLIVVESAADRWTGERTSEVLEGAVAIRNFAKRFVVNVEPR